MMLALAENKMKRIFVRGHTVTKLVGFDVGRSRCFNS